MPEVTFEILGLPPKKDGANSMWSNYIEIPRLIALRYEAHKAMGHTKPFVKNIQLHVQLYLTKNDHTVGDLDTFVAGICDGLMAAHGGANQLHEKWKKEIDAIQPDKTIAIEDDSQVMSIQAFKQILPAGGKDRYSVTISGEF